MEHTKTLQLQQQECIYSCDVKAVFTSVPVDPAISIIKNKLQQDPQLHKRTSMYIQHITTLLEFCLKNTCFLFQGTYYEQVHGKAMGFPISPLVANPFIEEFESKAFHDFARFLYLTHSMSSLFSHGHGSSDSFISFFRLFLFSDYICNNH